MCSRPGRRRLRGLVESAGHHERGHPPERKQGEPLAHYRHAGKTSAAAQNETPKWRRDEGLVELRVVALTGTSSKDLSVLVNLAESLPLAPYEPLTCDYAPVRQRRLRRRRSCWPTAAGVRWPRLRSSTGSGERPSATC